MAQPVIQSSFNSGEWSPNLYARVDIEKFHSGAALLRNFFVDYRGGASTRFGTKYVLRGLGDSKAIRLIPFQATFTVGYVMEFGDQYIRFYRNGAPVLESGLTITGATKAATCVITVANSYSPGDWVFISGVTGMTELNGKYYRVGASTGTTISLVDLFGIPVNSTGFGTYTGGGTTKRVYTIGSPYLADDLAALKFSQNAGQMVLTHPGYLPYLLTFVADASWQLAPIVFGTTITPPVSVSVTTTLSAGQTNYSYVVTSVDGNGQESQASGEAVLSSVQNLATTAGTNTIIWTPVTGAASYNVYKTNTTQVNPVPPGQPYGFIGNTTGTSLADSNIAADFSESPPIVRNPFASGAAVTSVTMTNGGTYTTIPTWTFAPPPQGTTATGTSVMVVNTVTPVSSPSASGYVVGEILTFTNGTVISVTGVSLGAVTSAVIVSGGLYSGSIPTNPVFQSSSTGSGINQAFDFTYTVGSVTITNGGTGYFSAPALSVSSGIATAVATIGPTTAGNPAVCAFFQQRLVFAAPDTAPQTLYFSQPGNYFNFNTSFPVQDDDSIVTSIVSGQLNTIRSMVPQPAGLIVFTDNSSWLVNGGQFGSSVTPASIVANAQSFNGANNVPPIVVVFDILYVQSKGTAVRDSLYNFYANVFTGEDITIVSSHLFYGYQILEWAWAEEPFKLVYAVRNDGTMLTLTFMKEQQFIGWAHSDTDGSFKSVATITEQTDVGTINAVYTVVERSINGQTVQYIERFADRFMPNGLEDAWCVDCGLQYSGTPATTFTGGEHLVGKTCTGIADGTVITPFVMPASGTFTLSTAASKVTVGLAYTPQLQTLPLDIRQQEGTVQGKQKKINAVTARVADTLGLRSGTDFNNLVPMKDLVLGEVGSMTNEVVTGLVTGDARVYLDPKYSDYGQYVFDQPNPWPATILGVMPQVSVGDTQK